MPNVKNEAVQISYHVQGEGNPLVLIHGWSCEGRYWDEFGYTAKLASDFKLIIPDLRGHGESDTPADGNFSDAAFASDVMAVLDDLGIGSAHVFGYSLGGWVAFELAAKFPSKIRSLIIGGAHPYAEDLSLLRSVSPADIAPMWETARAPFSAKSRQRLAAFDRRTLAGMVPDRADQTERVKAFRMPRLMLCGTTDFRFSDMKRYAESDHHWQFIAVEELDHLQTNLGPVRAGHSARAKVLEEDERCGLLAANWGRESVCGTRNRHITRLARSDGTHRPRRFCL